MSEVWTLSALAAIVTLAAAGGAVVGSALEPAPRVERPPEPAAVGNVGQPDADHPWPVVCRGGPGPCFQRARPVFEVQDGDACAVSDGRGGRLAGAWDESRLAGPAQNAQSFFCVNFGE